MAEPTYFEGVVDPLGLLSYYSSRRDGDRPIITANGSLTLSPGRVYSGVDGFSEARPVFVRFTMSGSVVSGGVTTDFVHAKLTSAAGVCDYDTLGTAKFYPNVRQWQSGNPESPVSWDIHVSMVPVQGTSPYFRCGNASMGNYKSRIILPGRISTTFYFASSFLSPAHIGRASYDPASGQVTLDTSTCEHLSENDVVNPTRYEFLALYRWRAANGAYVYTESHRPGWWGNKFYSDKIQSAAWDPLSEASPDLSIGTISSATEETDTLGYRVGRDFTGSDGVTYYRDFFQQSLQTIAPPVAS